MIVHAFGAYFGMAVSRVLYNEQQEKSTKLAGGYKSDIFALIGKCCSSHTFKTCIRSTELVDGDRSDIFTLIGFVLISSLTSVKSTQLPSLSFVVPICSGTGVPLCCILLL